MMKKIAKMGSKTLGGKSHFREMPKLVTINELAIGDRRKNYIKQKSIVYNKNNPRNSKRPSPGEKKCKESGIEWGGGVLSPLSQIDESGSSQGSRSSTTSKSLEMSGSETSSPSYSLECNCPLCIDDIPSPIIRRNKAKNRSSCISEDSGATIKISDRSTGKKNSYPAF